MQVTPTHYVREDGTKYLRVTEVIKTCFPDPGLQDWRASVGKVRADRALRHAEKIGTLVDRVITSLLMGKPVKAKVNAVEARQALGAFRKWQVLNPLAAVTCQYQVFSDDMGVAGTVDCITSDELFDWKTTSRMKPQHLLQLNAYWGLLPTAFRETVRHARIVRFDKILGDWEEFPFTYQPELFIYFGHLVEVYRGWERLTQPQEVAA